MILALLACNSGPTAESLIPDLRVISTIVEPPELAPTEQSSVSVVLGDPAGQGAEVMVWTCLPDGSGGCMEARGARELWVQIVEQDTVQITAPSATALWINEQQPQLPVPLFTLACTPGLCDIFNEVRSRPEPSSPAWSRLMTSLGDPSVLLAGLPFEGVALATQSMMVSNLPVEQRNQNPVLSPLSAERVQSSTAADASARIDFRVTDPQADELMLYGFTTLGGFGPASEPVDDDSGSLSWFPGPSATAGSSGTAWVVAVDGRGGSAVWQGTVEVVAP